MTAFNETNAIQSLPGEDVLKTNLFYPWPEPCEPCKPYEPLCDRIGCLVMHEPPQELPSDVVLESL